MYNVQNHRAARLFAQVRCIAGLGVASFQTRKVMERTEVNFLNPKGSKVACELGGACFCSLDNLNKFIKEQMAVLVDVG